MSLQSQYVIDLYRDVIQQKTDIATISGAHWVLTQSLLAWDISSFIQDKKNHWIQGSANKLHQN